MVRQSVLIALTLASVVVRAEQLPREVLDNAMADFRAGRIAESITGFDRVITVAPGVAPELWQRGIALGTTTPAQVMTAAGANTAAQFYAHFYFGLYLEATGDAPAGLDHIKQAAASRYATAGGYMHDVARVHVSPRAR